MDDLTLSSIDELGELEPLDSPCPEDRWQDGDPIPVPVECDPEKNRGLYYKFVSHVELQKNNRWDTMTVVGSEMVQNSFVDGDAAIPSTSGTPKPSGTAAVFHRKPNHENCVTVTRRPQRQRKRHKTKKNGTRLVRDLRNLISSRQAKQLDEKVQEIHYDEEDAGSSNSIGYSIHDAPSNQELSSKKHIVFMDLDNCQRLSRWNSEIPPHTYVLGFYGRGKNFKPPNNSLFYESLITRKCFYLHPQCGSTKDAADFALCTKVGNLDNQLPKHIPFTVISGDRGFLELKNQMDLSGRVLKIVDPHIIALDDIFYDFYDRYEDTEYT